MDLSVTMGRELFSDEQAENTKTHNKIPRPLYIIQRLLN